ncbi:hypothetical protein D9757_007164 [Collybiopsis confluens]|uniref:AB hydrolase-1 domain-containing protein n=1 Tax=Collybiopsis confluens TaxID=2823264 RepID=A0A8H5M4T9_9AGAR|nr:hypothetical protein D9757_007164 [Collybiopsis confluens]
MNSNRAPVKFMSNHVSSKLYIPHPAEAGCSIVGLLEQLTEAKPCPGRKIALILHGSAGGNHETPGTWRQGGLAEDLEDLRVVVDYLKVNYGYEVDLVVGHSRGSIVSFRWICTSEEGAKISGFVNASGRYRMEIVRHNPERNDIKKWQEAIVEKGYYDWSPVIARKQVNFRIHPEDIVNFTGWDTSFVWDSFPASPDVLTIHGLSDQAVPSYDAIIYARALSERSPGTHSLHLMEDADHNFTGRQDEVVDAILDWWSSQQQRSLKSGIWMPGIKFLGKL